MECHICDQGWKMYRTTGPLVPVNFWGCQKIFWQGGLPQFSRIIVVYVTNKEHIHRYICNPIKPHAMTTLWGVNSRVTQQCNMSPYFHNTPNTIYIIQSHVIGGNLYKSINQNLCLKYLPKSANRFESPYEIAATKEGKFSKFVT